MARRIFYESDEDLRNEKSIADHVASAYDMILKKMHMKMAIDYMAFDSMDTNALAVIEVKRRKISSKKYKTVILSLAKFNKGIEFYNSNDLSFIFAVEFNDGIFSYEYSPEDNFMIVFGGRKDRGDSQDIEPVIHIPIKRMEQLL